MSFDFSGFGSGAASGASAGAAAGPWGAAIGGLAGGLLGGLGGGGSAAAREAKRQRDLAIAELQGINPEAADAWLNAQEEDGGTKDAQMAALRNMQGVSNEQGMDAQARFMQKQAMETAAAQEQGQRQAIIANAAQRGTLGGGQELASQLTAQQGGANRSSMASTAAAAEAKNRALQAMQASGQLGGQVRQQNQAFQTNRLNNANSINQFNAQNRLNKGALLTTARTGAATQANTAAGQGMGMAAGLGTAAGGMVQPALDYFGLAKKKEGQA